jgi:hypothetical protein
VTALIIEPSSKQDAARVLAEAGVRSLSYRTVNRRSFGEFAPRLFQRFGRDQYPAEGGKLQRLFIDPRYAEMALAEPLP